MAIRLGLVLLLLALAMVAQSSSPPPPYSSLWDINGHFSGGGGGLVGDSIDIKEEMMMASESARRVLGKDDPISYAALRANNVPCNRRGVSYYNCGRSRRANPYKRGCSIATRCARGR